MFLEVHLLCPVVRLLLALKRVARLTQKLEVVGSVVEAIEAHTPTPVILAVMVAAVWNNDVEFQPALTAALGTPPAKQLAQPFGFSFSPITLASSHNRGWLMR